MKMKIKGKVILLIFLVVFIMISGLLVTNKFFLEKFYLENKEDTLLEIGAKVVDPNTTIDFQQLEREYNVLISIEKFQNLNSFSSEGSLTKEQVEHIREVLESGNKIFMNINMKDYRGESIYLFYPYLRGKYIEISTPLSFIQEGMKISTEYHLKLLALTLVLGIFLAFSLERGIEELNETNERLKEEIERERQIETLRKEFIANVSHELKTPIAIIQGYAQGLFENIASDEDKEFYAETIIEESKKMDGLVRELLLISHIESGQLKLTTERFDIILLIEEIVERIIVKYHDFKVELPSGEAYVYGDETYISRVLQNLIENAFKYSEESKSIKIGVEEKSDVYQIYIENRTTQVKKEDLKNIWTSFYRMNKNRNREGHGLGLAIVKGILQQHKSKFGVDIAKEKLRIWFELPKKTFFY